MGFGALTSFTGGGDLASSSSASADGDASFGGNAFNFKTNARNNNAAMLAIGLTTFVVGFLVAKAVK